MRVLILGTQLRSVLGSAASLKERGHDVCYGDSQNATQTEISERRVEVRTDQPLLIKQASLSLSDRRSEFLTKLWTGKASAGTLQLVRRFDPEILMCESDVWPLAKAISRGLAIPIVVYFTNVRGLKLSSMLRFNHEYSEIIRAPLSVAYSAWLAHLSDAVVLWSKKVERPFRLAGVRTAALIQPTYARYMFSRYDAFQVGDLRKPYVLALITISRTGNVKVDLAMLKALFCIARKIPAVQFVVVGTSIENLEKFGSTCSTSTPRNMLFTGKVFDDYVLERLYADASCVVCPVLVPSFSNRFLEALFYGKAIVTTNTIGDFYEGLVDGSHVIVEENLGMFHIAVSRIVRDESLRTKLEQGARSYYKNHLSPEKHGNLLESVLVPLVSRR